MNGDVHVRFREHLGVRFPRVTRHVICCQGSADSAMRAMRAMMTKLKLTVNEDKTRLCRLPQEQVEFLGYTIGRCYSPKTGRAYIGTRPSKKSVQRICQAVSDKTSRRRLLLDADTQVGQLNRMLTGWANYFCLGPVTKAYNLIDRYSRRRLRQWLCNKYKQDGNGTIRYSDQYLDTLGLVRLVGCRRNFPRANA